jgi:hypothetical protein
MSFIRRNAVVALAFLVVAGIVMGVSLLVSCDSSASRGTAAPCNQPTATHYPNGYEALYVPAYPKAGGESDWVKSSLPEVAKVARGTEYVWYAWAVDASSAKYCVHDRAGYHVQPMTVPLPGADGIIRVSLVVRPGASLRWAQFGAFYPYL